jgi:hypothetical protein
MLLSSGPLFLGEALFKRRGLLPLCFSRFSLLQEGLPGIMMKPPIIVDNFGDTMIFESVEKAEKYIEPMDVINEEYVAYDSEGRLLQLIAELPLHVVLLAAESEPYHAHELRRLLADFFERIGISTNWLERASLHDLVMKGLEYKTE